MAAVREPLAQAAAEQPLGGCGTGGIGLWLARALAVRLEAFDLSPVAIAHAASRRSAFGLPDDRAVFRVAELENTGLPGASAHRIVCVDALGGAVDGQAALCELGRVLAPGGRLVMTRASRRGAVPLWMKQARACELVIEHVDERPAEPALWERVYRLWIARSDELRHELGEDQARNMLCEAQRMLPKLASRRAVLLTLRHEVKAQVASGPADTMTAPRYLAERTPQ
ncbi:class I SAM-dependent methyltransferase [Streptomyces asoensis]|uniref:class I SAM-dependent methyltransferase n=1 Tax=Streptomyces asoensis TaxID=249586 RepID=UPI0033D01EB7